MLKNTYFTFIFGCIALIIFSPYFALAQNFTQSVLSGASSFNPTTLQFGPDGRLYVANLDGLIYVYTIERNAANTYSVTATETISLVKDIPNYDDDGKRNFSIVERQVTGLLVTGTGTNPILYVTSSDIRDGAGDKGDVNLDTNSGIISRLIFDGTSWDKVDVVRGLPRSEENHANNGVHLSVTEDTLFVPVAGMTNAGAPSNNFTFSCEYALSAAILSVDLSVIDTLPIKTDPFGQKYLYDLPTVDDPTRPGTVDENDPFGGNDGLNQAKLIEGGPVQVYAAGFRNSYDLEITSSGKMYTIDNGANGGWGGYPENEGAPIDGVSNVTNNYVVGEPGFINNLNGLHVITGPGYYGGHPNPIRANPSGAGLFTEIDGVQSFRTATTGANPLPADWPPVSLSLANPIEGDFQQPGVDDASILTYGPSTNGICEYTASNFNGSLQGNILSAGYDGSVFRAQLNATGDAVLNGEEILFSGFGTIPLDIVAQGDDQIFPGTIWVLDFADSKIFVFEPEDFDGGEIAFCAGEDQEGIDEDNDGYTNADEIDNGTNPCSAASTPRDNDKSDLGGFLVSDLNDTDDDDDGISDAEDAFPLDPDNGLTTDWPLVREFFNNDPGTGFFGLGFTGLMTDSATDYLDLYDQTAIVAGGTSGLMTVPAPLGDAFLGPNTQANAFQFGLYTDNTQCPFFIRTRVLAPLFGGNAPAANQSQGLFVGTGDQDNYVKIAIDGGIEILTESGGTGVAQNVAAPDIDQATYIDLYLTINPITGKVLASYQTDKNDDPIVVGDSIAITGPFLTALTSNIQAIAVGIITTSFGTGNEFNATWDFIEIDAVPSSSTAESSITDGEQNILTASTKAENSFTFTNTSVEGQKIESIEIDLSTAYLPELLIDAEGTIGSDTGQGFAINNGAASAGFTTETFTAPLKGGFQKVQLSFTDFNQGEEIGFSLDVDPGQLVDNPNLPANVSAISSAELAGATVKIVFEDCSEQISTISPSSTSISSALACIQQSLPNAPTIEFSQISQSEDLVFNPNQTLRIIGEPDTEMQVWISEYEQPDASLKSTDPYLGAFLIQQDNFTVTTNSEGLAEVPVELFYSRATAGINYIFAAARDGSCNGVLSNLQVLRVEDVNCEYLRVNAGSTSYLTLAGEPFTNDSLFSESNVFSIDIGDEILGTDDDFLYYSERWNSVFSYNIPVPANGIYKIRMHFAELFWTEPDSRVFDVSIEGNPVLRSFDIFAEVGIKTSLVKEFDIAVQDREINIIFNSLIDNAKVSAIEVLTPCNLLITSNEPEIFTSVPNINIYPNPLSGDKINLMLNNFKLGVELEYNIMDLTGRTYTSGIITTRQSNVTLELSLPEQMSSGLYFLQLSSGSEIFTKRLVKY